MRKIGYLRVSTKKQKHDRQEHILKRHCDEMFLEKASAATLARPVYEKVIRKLHPGDELVIVDIDRAYRSTRDALNEFHLLSARGIRMRVVNFPVDPNSDEGYFSFIMQCARAELERRLLVRRTREGLAAARAKGKVLGRPRKLNSEQVESARCRMLENSEKIKAIAKEYKVGRSTLYRALREGVTG